MIEQLAADNVGRREAWAFKRIVPLVGSQLTRALNLSQSGHDRALVRVRQELDDEAQSLIGEVRAHPAGQFALRIYAEERRRVLP